MMIFRQPHVEDVELVVTGKHGVESGEIAKRFLHHLRTRIDEDAMHGGRDAAQFIHTARGHKEAQRIFTLCFLVELANDFAKVINLVVRGSGTSAGFK